MIARALAVLAMLLSAVAPAHAQSILPQILSPVQVDPVGNLRAGSIILGKRLSGKTTLTPDAVQILGDGSTGLVSGMTARPKVWPSGLPVFARTFAERAGDGLSVKDFGAKGDGLAVDFDAFQNPAYYLGIGKQNVTVTPPLGGPSTVISDPQPTADRPGGHIRVPTGQYNLDRQVFTGDGVGMELDSNVCFVGPRPAQNGGGVWVPDLLAPVGNGSCSAVKTLAGTTSSARGSNVLLLAQTQRPVPSIPGVAQGIVGQDNALLIRQLVANDNPQTAGLVGMEIQQELAGGVNFATIWASHILTKLKPGDKPDAKLGEWEFSNFSGQVQPRTGIGRTSDPSVVPSTIGLHLTNIGNTPSTAGILFGGGGGWRYGSVCTNGAVTVWCWATVDGNHNPISGTTVDGKTHALSFGIGTATTAENVNGAVQMTGITPFASSDGAGGVALAASKISVGGVPIEGAATAWTPYTPTVATASGTVGSNIPAGAYKQIGKTVHFRAELRVSSNGSGAGAVYLGLPAPVKAYTSFSGVEHMATGNGLAVYAQPGQPAMVVKTANGGGYPITGTGPWYVVISGTYEAQ